MDLQTARACLVRGEYSSTTPILCELAEVNQLEVNQLELK